MFVEAAGEGLFNYQNARAEADGCH